MKSKSPMSSDSDNIEIKVKFINDDLCVKLMNHDSSMIQICWLWYNISVCVKLVKGCQFEKHNIILKILNITVTCPQ